jgi:LacI family transcriptional regulator
MPPAELVPRQSTDVVAVDNPLIAKAMRFIMERSHRSISVLDVASHVGVTRWTLLRLFHHHLGHTVEHFITRLRHERLKRVLVESDEPLKVIAQESGFRNAVELSKSFHRLEGMTPSQYRRQS